MNRSQDFQWSGGRVLLQHIDPWMEYLRGDPAHRFILSQVPNYLPVLYVLLVPVGLLSLSYAKGLWVFCNLTFAVTSSFTAARFYQFSRPQCCRDCVSAADSNPNAELNGKRTAGSPDPHDLVPDASHAKTDGQACMLGGHLLL